MKIKDIFCSFYTKIFVGFIVLQLVLFSLHREHPTSQSTIFENGVVVNVYDGDTIKMKDGKKIRIWGIDAPELKQEYGEESRKYLDFMLNNYNYAVKLEIYGEDLYNRYLAKILVGTQDVDIGLLMVERGYAWAYKTNRDKKYLNGQEYAKFLFLGLWGLENEPIPPWVFRKIKGEENDD